MFGFLKRRRILRALRSLKSGVLGVSFAEILTSIKFKGAGVSVIFSLPNSKSAAAFENEVRNLAYLCGFKADDIKIISNFESTKKGEPQHSAPKRPSGIKKIIAVAACKGGVGKSTIALNLALNYAKKGLRTGLLDADIYGPSIPLMLGIEGVKPEVQDGKLMPIVQDGVSIISMGMLVKAEDALMWRGSMVTKMIKSFFEAVLWGELDVLIVDLPPGTGDVYLSLLENYGIDEAILVTTQHEIAVNELQKTVTLLKKFGIKIRGVIENMVEDSSLPPPAFEGLKVLERIPKFPLKKEGFPPINLGVA